MKHKRKIRKLLTILSSILLILNPGCGLMLVASIMYGHYTFIPAVIVSVIVVSSTLKFHCYTTRFEDRLNRLRHFQWRREFSKTHDFISSSTDYDGIEYQVWQNKKTKQFIEV